MPQYLDILFIFFTAFIIAFISIPKVISLAEKLRLFAPKVKRASHKGKIPSLELYQEKMKQIKDKQQTIFKYLNFHKIDQFVK